MAKVLTRLVAAVTLIVGWRASAQPSYWFQGFQRQGNAKLAQEYWFLPGTNMVFSYDNRYVYLNSLGGGGTNVGPVTNYVAGTNITFTLLSPYVYKVSTTVTNGINGTNGLNGTNGINGINGTNGLNGINGTNGVNGTNGLPGAAGTNALTIATNTVLVSSVGATNLNFADGTNIHFTGSASGQTITVQADLNAPSNGNFYAQLNGAWSTIPLGGNLTYYLEPTNSPDVASYLAAATSPYPTRTVETFSSIAASQVLTNLITDAGVPAMAFIPAGAYEFHIHAARTSGTKTVSLYAEFWEANSSGVDIAKIGTSESSAALTGGELEYRLYYASANIYTLASSASRIVCRIYVTLSGAGLDPTVELYFGGEADSHIAIPSAQVASANVTLIGDTIGSGSGTITTTTTNLSWTLITNRVYWTNAVSLTNPQSATVDMELKEGDLQTTGALTLTGIIHRSDTNYQSVVITVTNTAGTAAAIIAPANTHTNGFLPYLVTNVSKVLLEYHPRFNYTNMLVYPLF